jgi:probable rRNA maturation factor
MSSARAQKAKRNLESTQRSVPLQPAIFESFLDRLNRELGLSPASTFVRFVTDAEMTRLNRTFRHKPGTTDVLSFPTETRTRPVNLAARARTLRHQFLGDIAISPRIARRNARTFHRTLPQEICILILHGLLHLLGYDHENDRGEMDRVEAKLRRRFGLA